MNHPIDYRRRRILLVLCLLTWMLECVLLGNVFDRLNIQELLEEEW